MRSHASHGRDAAKFASREVAYEATGGVRKSRAPDMDDRDERWAREAERLHRRYVVEVVEAFGLCPWAERARIDGRTRVTVLVQTDATALQPAVDAIDQLAADGRVEIGFLLFPRLPLGRPEFDRFTARVRSAEATRREAPGGEPFAFAAFHPEATANLKDAERLIPFLRRTPDPCIQLVRMTTLDRVRGSKPQGTQLVDLAAIEAFLSGAAHAPSLRDRIAHANLETMRRVGTEAVDALIEDILRDRRETYRALERRA